MPKYRVYSVNSNGQIHGDRFVNASDDQDAIFAVDQLAIILNHHCRR